MRKTTNRHWLDIAEYLSLAGSVAGSVAAVVSQQVAYAAAPLTVALSLSLANRQRCFEQAQQQTTRAIAHVHHSVESLHHKIPLLPSTEQVGALEASMIRLSATTSKLEQSVQVVDTRGELDALVQAFSNRPELEEIDKLKVAIAQLLRRLDELPSPTEPFDPVPLAQKMAALERSVNKLQENTSSSGAISVDQKLLEEIKSLRASVQARFVGLEVLNFEPIQADILCLQQSLKDTTQRFDVTLTSLEAQVGALVARSDALGSEIEDQAQKAVHRWAEEINQRLQAIRRSHYQLVSNRNESRQVLLEALDSAQERLIIVCPWLTRSAIDNQVIQKFRTLLNRNVCIDVGWGHLSDIGMNQPAQLCRQQLLDAVSHKSQGWKYNALPQLEQLEQEYQGRFRLRLLGTHEKYLVCDRSFAMLGSHNFLTSGISSSEREVGLRTNDPNFIEDLIKRFEDTKDLELQESNIAPPVLCDAQILLSSLADTASANAAFNF